MRLLLLCMFVALVCANNGTVNFPKSRFCGFKSMVCTDKNGQKLSAAKGPAQYALDGMKGINKGLKDAQEETRKEVFKLKSVVDDVSKNIEQVKTDLLKISEAIANAPGSIPKEGVYPRTDCKVLYKEGKTTNGVYSIRPGTGDSKEAYCYHGFTVLQRRVTGAESFERTFVEYRDGFGNPSSDHWFGLEAMHQMTKDTDCSLRIMVQLDPRHKDPKEFRHIEVRKFSVLEGDGYEGVFIGPSTDMPHTDGANGLESYHSKFRYPFATKDNFLGADRYKCAQKTKVGWWYVNCALIDLNQNVGIDAHHLPGVARRCTPSAENRICAQVHPYIAKQTYMLLQC